jgi:ABC-type transport system involved in multi-copper enzyme maturation permease subunit
LEPLQAVSPFHWAPPGDLISGGSAIGFVWLLIVTVGFVVIAAWSFERRDVGRS